MIIKYEIKSMKNLEDTISLKLANFGHYTGTAIDLQDIGPRTCLIASLHHFYFVFITYGFLHVLYLFINNESKAIYMRGKDC